MGNYAQAGGAIMIYWAIGGLLGIPIGAIGGYLLFTFMNTSGGARTRRLESPPGGAKGTWNEEKGQRFEDLHKRKGELSDAERAELAALTSELEGVESAIMAGDINRKPTLARLAPRDTAGNVPTWISVGAGAGGLFALAFTLWRGYYYNTFLFSSAGAIFGSLLGFALWVTLTSRRVSAISFVFSWGLLGAAGGFLFAVGASFVLGLALPSVMEMTTGEPLVPLLFSLPVIAGAITGLVVGVKKWRGRKHKDNEAEPEPAADGGRDPGS